MYLHILQRTLKQFKHNSKVYFKKSENSLGGEKVG